MNSRPLSLTDLDALVESVGLPVRAETLEEKWDLMPAHEQAAPDSGRVFLLATMRARPGLGAQLEDAALEFVRASNRLAGALGSTLYRSSNDPLTFHLMERFSSSEAFGEHMASAYFQRFQLVQQSVLAEPVEAIFLAGTRR